MQKSKYYSIGKDGDKYILTIKNTHIPLFRYRSFNKYSLSDLINDELSFSTPDNFNDPYDCAVVYNRNIIQEILELFFKEIGIFINKAEVEKHIESTISLIKQCNGIACFSENINNEIMWAHYSNCGKGFALEYSYESLKNLSVEYEKNQMLYYQTQINNDKLSVGHAMETIAPVIYNNRKYDITNLLLDTIKHSFYNKNQNSKDMILDYLKSQDEEELKTINNTILYSKNKDWQYEKEWRLVASMPNYEFGSGYFSLSGIKAKNIYLGEFIDEKSETILRKIADDKKMNVYKMKTKQNNLGMKLSYSILRNR